MCRQCLPEQAARVSRRLVCGGLVAAALVRGAGAARLPATGDLEELSLHVPSRPEAARTVALTLDACGGETDERILGALIEHGIAATIFATALWLRGNHRAFAAMRERPDLFAIENHGARHLPPVLGDRRVYGLTVAGTLDAVRGEVTGGADALIAAGAPRPGWYRGATGLYSPAAAAEIQAMGWRIAGYALNADEGASLPAGAVAPRIAAARSGDVIIGHINQPNRSSGAGIVDGVLALQRTGTAFVTLDGAAPANPA